MTAPVAGRSYWSGWEQAVNHAPLGLYPDPEVLVTSCRRSWCWWCHRHGRRRGRHGRRSWFRWCRRCHRDWSWWCLRCHRDWCWWCLRCHRDWCCGASVVIEAGVGDIARRRYRRTGPRRVRRHRAGARVVTCAVTRGPRHSDEEQGCGHRREYSENLPMHQTTSWLVSCHQCP